MVEVGLSINAVLPFTLVAGYDTYHYDTYHYDTYLAEKLSVGSKYKEQVLDNKQILNICTGWLGPDGERT